MIGVGLFVGVETFAARSASIANAIALAVCALALGAGLIAVGRGLYRAQRWSRTPAVLTQVFGFITGVYLVQSQQYAYGIPIIVVTVAAVVLIFTPAATRSLTG